MAVFKTTKPFFNQFSVGTDSLRFELTSQPGGAPIEWAAALFADNETKKDCKMIYCTRSLFHSEYPLVDGKPPAVFLMEFIWTDSRDMHEVPGYFLLEVKYEGVEKIRKLRVEWPGMKFCPDYHPGLERRLQPCEDVWESQ
eukprot:3887895-Rhodomonas_salina.1